MFAKRNMQNFAQLNIFSLTLTSGITVQWTMVIKPLPSPISGTGTTAEGFVLHELVTMLHSEARWSLQASLDSNGGIASQRTQPNGLPRVQLIFSSLRCRLNGTFHEKQRLHTKIPVNNQCPGPYQKYCSSWKTFELQDIVETFDNLIHEVGFLSTPSNTNHIHQN
ncbi:hypothetical protein GQX74_014651 [Glossina fuscipes]|nr:hypothetical protein GQX74_014651 [Glossina fuscipes]